MENVKLSSGEWVKLSGIVVLDPDGWDRRGEYFQADWDKPITFDEFWDKCSLSTTMGHRDYNTIRSMIVNGILNKIN